MTFVERFNRIALVVGASVMLAACATGPADNISLIRGDQTGDIASKDGLFTQPVKYQRSKPGCKGDCPTIKVDSIVFPGNPKLSELVDHALATMTGVGETQRQPYATLGEYETYFWNTAAARDETVFSAKTRYRNKNLTVIELDTWQYFTGAAHGISATQFLNWDNQAGRVLGIRNVIEPGTHDAYLTALRQAHANWLASNPDAQHDPAAYNRLWPFQPSDNYAFTDAGLIVKYDSYQIAPYSSGHPELLIPYAALEGILKRAYLPAG